MGMLEALCGFTAEQWSRRLAERAPGGVRRPVENDGDLIRVG
jgi:hypothetical protein